jgi:uncharacterized membrane protein HdeD (DUF308 family)
MGTRIADDWAARGRRASGVQEHVRYLRLSTIAMLVVGVLSVITGATTDVGAIAILFGMLMIVSGIVKIIALRIMDGESPSLTWPRRDER